MKQISRIKDNAYVSSSSPGGSTGGEVSRLRLSLVFFEAKGQNKYVNMLWCHTGLLAHPMFAYPTSSYEVGPG